MIDLNNWMNGFMEALEAHFGQRLWFVGLQGSYGRGEETDSSDIDLVVILDTLSPEDIRAYNRMLDGLPHRELICGFLSGKEELANWEPSDLFQLVHDTTPIRGSLEELMPLITDEAVTRAIKIGVCNIYHGCVHNMLYEKSEDIVRGLYKAAAFTVQSIVFRQTGTFLRRQRELLDYASPEEEKILKTGLELKSGGAVSFDEMSETLAVWSASWIRKTGQ